MGNFNIHHLEERTIESKMQRTVFKRSGHSSTRSLERRHQISTSQSGSLSRSSKISTDSLRSSCSSSVRLLTLIPSFLIGSIQLHRPPIQFPHFVFSPKAKLRPLSLPHHPPFEIREFSELEVSPIVPSNEKCRREVSQRKQKIGLAAELGRWRCCHPAWKGPRIFVDFQYLRLSRLE